MRIVFMGTPDLAACILRHVADAHDVVAVYTRPDTVRGRGSKLVASPVKIAAQELGIPVLTPNTLRGDEAVSTLASFEPDFVCVSAYGALLPQEILDVPRYGCLNVHASLLPRWRGAAPIERAILAGDETTGVCIMRMEAGLDTGDYCKRVEFPVGDASVGDLSVAIAEEGGKALVAAIDDIANGTAVWTAQNDDEVTYASKLEKGDLALSPLDDARTCAAKVRASSPAHPARMRIADRSLCVEEAAEVTDPACRQYIQDMQPGDVRFTAKRLLLGCADGAVELLRVRPDCKKSMDARSFAGGIQGIKNTTLTWGEA